MLLLGILIGWVLFTQFHVSNETSNQPEVMQEEEIWTCSMHPQIRSHEPGDCPICGMDLIPLETNASSDPTVLQMTEDAVALANIQTIVVGESSSQEEQVKLNGVLKANETLTASLVSHIPGRIEQLSVSFTGEKVVRGQKLATIYSPQLITAQKELIEAKKLVAISPEFLEAAKNKLRFWKISSSVIDQIIESETVRESFSIYAEHTGIVKSKKISVGDYINTGEVLFTVENLSQLWVLLDVYEKDIQAIKLGNDISFTTIAYPNQVFKSKIVFIDPNINASTRVTTVRAELNNSANLLKPEMFVKAMLNINKNDEKIKITVPKTSVLWTGERSVVYVKQADAQIPSFEYKEVKLGDVIGRNYEILEGIKIGDEVVINGAFVIDAAAQLNNQNSMMNKKVSVKEQFELKIIDFKKETPAEFKMELQNVVNEYFELKNALVDTDLKTAQTKTEGLLVALSAVNMSHLSGEGHIYWMEQHKSIEHAAKQIVKSVDIDELRVSFEFLSNGLINSISAFGLQSMEVNVFNCPMANNGGADWLSNGVEVLNPYFGSKMLKCGSLIETIK